jgi:hypothetical protein
LSPDTNLLVWRLAVLHRAAWAFLESCVVYRAAQFARAVRRVKLTISCKWSRTQEKSAGLL